MSVGQNIFEKNKIYHGDCLEVMKQIPDKYIDHIICDLPFYQVVKDEWDNQWKDEKDYINWCRGVIIEYKRICIFKLNDMKFRIVEKQFENKSEFCPEWFCDNANACNHGWNSVHDSRLMTIPTNTYEDSLKRIKWFSNCFQKPLMEVIHEVVTC